MDLFRNEADSTVYFSGDNISLHMYRGAMAMLNQTHRIKLQEDTLSLMTKRGELIAVELKKGYGDMLKIGLSADESIQPYLLNGKWILQSTHLDRFATIPLAWDAGANRFIGALPIRLILLSSDLGLSILLNNGTCKKIAFARTALTVTQKQ